MRKLLSIAIALLTAACSGPNLPGTGTQQLFVPNTPIAASTTSNQRTPSTSNASLASGARARAAHCALTFAPVYNPKATATIPVTIADVSPNAVTPTRPRTRHIGEVIEVTPSWITLTKKNPTVTITAWTYRGPIAVTQSGSCSTQIWAYPGLGGSPTITFKGSHIALTLGRADIVGACDQWYTNTGHPHPSRRIYAHLFVEYYTSGGAHPYIGPSRIVEPRNVAIDPPLAILTPRAPEYPIEVVTPVQLGALGLSIPGIQTLGSQCEHIAGLQGVVPKEQIVMLHVKMRETTK